MKRQAWSYSALTAFETCPKRYEMTKIAKAVQDPPSEAMKEGQRTHQLLEFRIKGKMEFPHTHAYLEPIVQKFLNIPHDSREAEVAYTFNQDLGKTDWFAKDAWFRAKVDLEMLMGKRALAIDWKTGKMKPDSDQMELFAATMFLARPELEQVKTGFVWLKDLDHTGMPKVTPATYKREDFDSIWPKFMMRVERLDDAIEASNFPARPSGLCARHCPVPKSLCPHSGKAG